MNNVTNNFDTFMSTTTATGLTIQQMGKLLLREALKTSSFGTKEKDLEKSYKTKYIIES